MNEETEEKDKIIKELKSSIESLEKKLDNIKPSAQKRRYSISNPQIISRLKPKPKQDEDDHATRMAEGRARDQTGNFYLHEDQTGNFYIHQMSKETNDRKKYN